MAVGHSLELKPKDSESSKDKTRTLNQLYVFFQEEADPSLLGLMKFPLKV